MGSLRLRLLVLGALCLASAVSFAVAAEPDEPAGVKPAPTGDTPAGLKPGPVVQPLFGPAATSLTPEQMSARIDELLGLKWTEKGVKPAPLADDAEYFRRLSLDLNGRIPIITQMSDFLDDNRADKKRIWTELLMQDRDNVDLFVTHWTNFWRHTVLAHANNQQQAVFAGPQMEQFFRNHVKNNTPYDQMVRELLTGNMSNVLFQAAENKPENMASQTSRLFLGVKLECAQCHEDRSGGNWSQVQFWQYAAFYVNNGRGSQPTIQVPDRKKQTVPATFLDGGKPQWRSGASSATILAEWMTSPNNAYFARAVVNRMWHYFMGVGFVDPVDAASEENPASHPELLDELARQFVAHKFDMKFLIRAITGSRAYQLTSVRTDASQDDPRLFARMNVRGMSPEQLFDSLAEATGYFTNGNRGFNEFGQPITPRNEFINRFANPNEKRTDTQTSILQALFLMNGKHTEDTLKNSKSLRTVQENVLGNAEPNVTEAAVPAMVFDPVGAGIMSAGTLAHRIDRSVRRNVTELFIVTLSRKPRAEELDRLVKYVRTGGPTKKREDALADIFWALINSGEFMLNH